MYKLLRSCYFLLIIFLAVSIYAQTKHIKIVQTTDTHGAITSYSLTYENVTNGGLARVMTYLENERANTNQDVILLSGGDILQGTPEVYYYNFEKTDVNHLYADVMNYMKYDAGVVGNHDIETGHDVYDKFTKELNFPWLAANATNTEIGEPYFPPYSIIEKDGIKIAVLGLITPGIPKWLPKQIWSGIFFDDMVESAKKWVPIILENEKPDLLVGLFHSGVDHTYGGEENKLKFNENASKLVAEQVPGFDIIFVGHDHKGWNTTVKNSEGKDVYILGGTSSGRDISVADIEFAKDEEKAKWNFSISGSNIEMGDYSPNEKFMETFSLQIKEVQKYVSKPLAVFTDSVSTRDALFGPSLFVDLINNIQLQLTGADISFSAPLSYNAAIAADTVFVKDMFKLYKYENLLYTMSLSGEEVDKYLEYSVSEWYNNMEKEDDHLIAFQFEEDGKIKFNKRYNSPVTKTTFYNYDAAAGINYEVDITKPEGNKVTITSMSDGSEFNMGKKYKVAINSYRGNGGGNHLTKGVGIPIDKLEQRIITSTEKDLRYYLMKWIEDQKIVKPTLNNNWKVIPEDWFSKGKAKDYKIMYGE